MTDVSPRASSFRMMRSPEQLTREYRERMYSPLCGLIVAIGYSAHSRKGPRVSVAGGELTGVHVLQNQPAPRTGSYHIGGSGIVPFEPTIKTFGESAERYAGSISALDPGLEQRFASHNEMEAAGCDVISASKLVLIDENTVRSASDPFKPFDANAPITWIEAENIGSGSARKWIPAQQFLVGYPVRIHDGEPWLEAAVSTGTAVHTDYPRATLAALYELIQIDSAMGHWYGSQPSMRIEFDERTTRLQRLLARHMPEGGYLAEFHLLPNADLPGFTIACLLHEPQGRIPVVSVGLGADSRLESAMYKAWLEAVGVRSLAEWSLVNTYLEEGELQHDTGAMLDLDSNVVYAAQAEGASAVRNRFANAERVLGADLPPDSVLDVASEVRRVVRTFRATNKELFIRSLSTPDVAAFGFRAIRVWSPDTLSLCLPSAPPQRHPRFGDYGGFTELAPHPYP
ncbi:YcaO-like family protein [Microbacterium trichothecenolyticum]|uniref:Thiazole/oxazole-forming peptide maturase SagD family component n=1 Tax=Microbacterium trichothecenolyticum TaxID=69370 RepID=A0ABU0TSK9_MICTR|nr:YcaO-like family protein [Microbacterium trichothecenolyticum]MDQ1122638.1 thiazole/oxazole-forming peptide maturase SagD family component [Microbacterium trichothecenolyticum]